MAGDFRRPVSDVPDAELAAVIGTLVSLPVHDVQDDERFFSQVQVLIESRARRDWPGESDAEISLFIRTNYPRQAASEFTDAQPSADMIGTDEPLMGRVFLLDRNASQGWSAALPHADAGHIIQWLHTVQFRSNQCILVYRKTLILIERSKGAEGGTTRQASIRTTPPNVTYEGLLKALDLFHLREILTPQNCPNGLWRPGYANVYHAGPTPETSIQARLKTFLTGTFQGYVRVSREITTDIGRIDIQLLLLSSDINTGLAYWGIIELKVVKSFRHSETKKVPVKVRPIENARDVAKGVQQAFGFRKICNCPHSILEIYDMRANKTTDPREHSEVRHVLSTCIPAPNMRLTPLFGSAQQARDAGYYPDA